MNKRGARPACVALLLLAGAAAAADPIGDAVEASMAAQRAARESQQRVDRLAAATRELQERRRAAEWQGLQLAAYAEQLEQEALVQEQRAGMLEAELARVAATGTGLLPLAQRLFDELEAHVTADLPFLAERRNQRLGEVRALLADPQRGQAEKFRRVLEAWRTEVEYGYTLGAEDAATDCSGGEGTATRVRVGRVALYCLDAGGAARWDAAAAQWAPLEDDDEIREVARAAAMAREKEPAGLLVLPVEAGGPP